MPILVYKLDFVGEDCAAMINYMHIYRERESECDSAPRAPDAFIREKADEFARGDYGKPSSSNLRRQ